MRYEERDCLDCIHMGVVGGANQSCCLKYRYLYPASWLDEQVKICQYYEDVEEREQFRKQLEESFIRRGW